MKGMIHTSHCICRRCWPHEPGGYEAKAGANRITPMNATLEHDTTSEHCWCSPRIERYEGGTLIIHNEEN